MTNASHTLEGVVNTGVKTFPSIKNTKRTAESQVTMPVPCDLKTYPGPLHCFQAQFNEDISTVAKKNERNKKVNSTEQL